MKKVLIFRGGWDGHHPIQVSELFREVLEKEGFEVTISDQMDPLGDVDYLKSLDMIIPIWTMGTIDHRYVCNISEAVESGVALCGCHGGMCDAFREDVDWQFMTGSQWVSHPGGDGIVYQVNLVPDTYFTRGLSDFTVASEQYYIHVDPANRVYATTTFPVYDGPHAANGPVAVPVVYTRLWGKGRIFYTSLGHTEEVFLKAPEALEIMRRGFIWATGGAEA